MKYTSSVKRSFFKVGGLSAVLLLAACSATDCDPNKQDEMFSQMACSAGGYQKRTNALTKERDTQADAVRVQNAHLTGVQSQLASIRKDIIRLKAQLVAENAQREKLLQDAQNQQNVLNDAINAHDQAGAAAARTTLAATKQAVTRLDENTKRTKEEVASAESRLSIITSENKIGGN